MRLEQHPIYRKAFVPWYDSETACLVIIGLMIPVILFGISGILLSGDVEQFAHAGWVPALLTGLCGWVIISMGFRLLYRRLKQI